MPITKKKGAIFAIYSDSPRAASASASASASAVSGSIATAARSPTKKPSSRRALGAIQPKSLAVGFPSAPALQLDATEKNLVPKPASSLVNDGKAANPPITTATKPSVSASLSVNPKPAKVTPKVTRQPTRSAPSKRQLEIFTSPAIGAGDRATAAVVANSSSAYETPESCENGLLKSSALISAQHRVQSSSAKRSRFTNTDKENVRPVNLDPSHSHSHSLPGAPAPDSPASRTRSKSRSTPIAIPISDSTPHTNSNSGFSPLAEPVSKSKTTVTKHTLFQGDGRGAFSLKKGREVAARLAQGDIGPGPDLAAGALCVNGRAGKGPGARNGKGEWRAGDGPLVDVSLAYGATGDEPEGFRSARGDV